MDQGWRLLETKEFEDSERSDHDGWQASFRHGLGVFLEWGRLAGLVKHRLSLQVLAIPFQIVEIPL
jgi:hypothetical protein